jgi:hypothetical protein
MCGGTRPTRRRARQTTHRLKNLAILGGLLELALD